MCKHANNWTIKEEGTAFSSHTFRNGEMSHYSDIDDYTGMASFQCHECGKRIRFNTYKPRAKWLAARLETACKNKA